MATPPEQKLSEYLGALCEVLSPANQLLFVGIIRAYHRGMNELEIRLYKGDEAPRGMLYNDQVKLRVHTSRGLGSVVLLYAALRRCAEDFWRVEVQGGIQCLERRSSFRQRVDASGMIWRLPAESGEGAAPCQLTDISLNGVGLISRAILYEGDRILLREVFLDGEEPHAFRCHVRRVQKQEGLPIRYLYGCSFYGLTQQEEDRLCQAIFTLQARDLNRQQREA